MAQSTVLASQFITFEGVEGSGKSTLIQGLAAHFENLGHKVLCTREPGGSALGKTLRALLLDTRTEICSQAELFLFLADRAQHVQQVIRPALAQGYLVLCDRFIHSTIAYQGGARGLDVQSLQVLNAMAIDGLMPQKVLFLDLPVEMGLARAQARNAVANSSESEGKFDAQHLDFHKKVQDSYYQQAKADAQRFCFVDASQSTQNVLKQGIEILTNGF